MTWLPGGSARTAHLWAALRTFLLDVPMRIEVAFAAPAPRAKCSAGHLAPYTTAVTVHAASEDR